MNIKQNFSLKKLKNFKKIKKFKSEGINSNCVKLNNVMKVLESNKNRINLTDESFYRKKSFSNNFDDVYQISKESESDFWYFLILNPENEIKKENQNNLIKKQEIGFILKYKKNFDAFGNNNLEKVSFKTIFNEKNNVSKEKSVDLMHEIFVN